MKKVISVILGLTITIVSFANDNAPTKPQEQRYREARDLSITSHSATSADRNKVITYKVYYNQTNVGVDGRTITTLKEIKNILASDENLILDIKNQQVVDFHSNAMISTMLEKEIKNLFISSGIDESRLTPEEGLDSDRIELKLIGLD